MKTLVDEEEEHQSTARVARLALPNEVIDELISRLPVKCILRSKSVCKPWLSRISDRSFAKLQLTRATSALFISAYDKVTRKHHFLSAAADGGPFTLLMTFDYSQHNIRAEHLNGLVFFTCKKLFYDYNKVHAFVANPSTRQILTLPDPTVDCCSEYANLGYLFGFDESRNEHKVLLIRKLLKSSTIEFMIYSLSNHSWRKINVEHPVGFSWDRLSCGLDCGVCVNSVVYVMLLDLSYDILAFDLKTEELSIVNIPQGVAPSQVSTIYTRNGKDYIKDDIPLVVKINGRVGVVFHHRVAESNGIDIWILQDYDNRAWVRETVKFPESWSEFGGPFPVPVDVHMDEILFSSHVDFFNVSTLHVYNMKTRCFKLLQNILDDQFLSSETVKLSHIKWYAESIMPL